MLMEADPAENLILAVEICTWGSLGGGARAVTSRWDADLAARCRLLFCDWLMGVDCRVIGFYSFDLILYYLILILIWFWFYIIWFWFDLNWYYLILYYWIWFDFDLILYYFILFDSDLILIWYYLNWYYFILFNIIGFDLILIWFDIIWYYLIRFWFWFDFDLILFDFDLIVGCRWRWGVFLHATTYRTLSSGAAWWAFTSASSLKRTTWSCARTKSLSSSASSRFVSSRLIYLR